MLAVCLTWGHQAASATWQRYHHPGFTLVTDLSHEDTLALAAQLERFERVTEHFIGPPDLKDLPPLHMVVFARRALFDKVVDRAHFAAYTQPEVSRTTLVVGPDERGDPTLNTLHEYVHYRLRTQPLAYPVWYEEGLATLLSAAEYDASIPAMRVGHALPVPLERHRGPMPRLDRVEGVASVDDWPVDSLAGLYRQSARLVQLLLIGPTVGLSDHRDALARHLARRQGDLFTDLGVSASDLARMLRTFVAREDRGSVQLILDPAAPLPEMTPQPLSDVDVDELLARIAELPNPGYARRVYRRLTRLAPSRVEYRVALARMQAVTNVKRAEGTLASAAALDAEHPEVLVARAALATQTCPIDPTLACVPAWQAAGQLLRDALARNPDHFEAMIRLGIVELYTGRPGDAVHYLRVAHHRAPWSDRVNFHLGECLRLLGNPRAEIHLRQARTWARSEATRALAGAALDLLYAGRAGSG